MKWTSYGVHFHFVNCGMSSEQEKINAAKAAVKMIEDQQIVGLGTGSTAVFAIREIAERVQKGLFIKCIPTSDTTAALARELSIPLADINAVEAIDITIDGADEFTEELYLIKGGGGALLKEKIVAAKTRREIIIADSSKHVKVLGAFKLPVEVIPFACNYVLQELRMLKGIGVVRKTHGHPFITDEGNYIIDVDFKQIENPVLLDEQLNRIVGVVEHGLFIDLAAMILMGEGDSVRTFSKHHTTFTS